MEDPGLARFLSRRGRDPARPLARAETSRRSRRIERRSVIRARSLKADTLIIILREYLSCLFRSIIESILRTTDYFATALIIRIADSFTAYFQRRAFSVRADDFSVVAYANHAKSSAWQNFSVIVFSLLVQTVVGEPFVYIRRKKNQMRI